MRGRSLGRSNNRKNRAQHVCPPYRVQGASPSPPPFAHVLFEPHWSANRNTLMTRLWTAAPMLPRNWGPARRRDTNTESLCLCPTVMNSLIMLDRAGTRRTPLDFCYPRWKYLFFPVHSVLPRVRPQFFELFRSQRRKGRRVFDRTFPPTDANHSMR